MRTPSEALQKRICGALGIPQDCAAIHAFAIQWGRRMDRTGANGSGGRRPISNSASPTYLTDLRPGERPEPSSHDYAEGKPPTYFDVTRVKLDVDKAFEVANKEAAIAKVGFDRLDYSLRAREFSQEPVWTLRLVNEEEQLVGTVELSAESGRVFRTIWLRRGPEPGQIRVIDSVLAAGGPTAASSASGASLENDLPALPPTPNLDPDAPANPAAPGKPDSINVVEPVSPPKTP